LAYFERAYQQTTNKQIHIALTKGTWNLGESILTRINSSQVNNDLLGTLTNNADQQLMICSELLMMKEKALLFYQSRHAISNLLNRIAELKLLQSEGVMKHQNYHR
jgi:3,4-dihydroxy 2-butanone 4-phosphate synthase/GTP cyclohydrolase II